MYNPPSKRHQYAEIASPREDDVTDIILWTVSSIRLVHLLFHLHANSPSIMTQLTPLSFLRVSRHIIPAHRGFPNSSTQNRSLYIYHAAFPSSSSPSSIEQHLRSVGVVSPAWRYKMYTQHHFHSTAHEVLVISSGGATLFFGGEGNPKGVQAYVGKGDVIVVPAGVGHAMLEDKGGFEMVGSYPVGGAQWDHCTGDESELGKVKSRIERLGWFERDPLYGDEGPVLE